MNDDTISRAAAIDAVRKAKDKSEAHRMIIQLPSAQPVAKDINVPVKDCISRQAVLDALEDISAEVEDGDGFQYEKWRDYICDLPSVQPERTDCEYCHEDIDGYVKPIEKNCHAFIQFGMNGWELNLRAKGWHGEVKIKYCPICGRRLEL